MGGAPFLIEVAYAEPHRGIVKPLHLAPGSCVADALRLAALDPDFSGVDFEKSDVGIFGRPARREHVLEDGDRVEIYRPLATDPKEARRTRARDALKKL
jgi:putative ubiquitin-RnfH superfamily antitoxin RatB of RatAB toxin-antitoxin module